MAKTNSASPSRSKGMAAGSGGFVRGCGAWRRTSLRDRRLPRGDRGIVSRQALEGVASGPPRTAAVLRRIAPFLGGAAETGRFEVGAPKEARQTSREPPTLWGWRRAIRGGRLEIVGLRRDLDAGRDSSRVVERPSRDGVRRLGRASGWRWSASLIQTSLRLSPRPERSFSGTKHRASARPFR